MNLNYETASPQEISNHTDKQLRVLRDFIVIKKVDVKTKDTGLVQIVRFDERLMTGIVCQVGTGVLTSNGQLHDIEVHVGELVTFDKMNSREITTKEGEKFTIINELSILAVIR